MEAKSLLSCDSIPSGLKLPSLSPSPSPSPPTNNSLISRRYLFLRPVTISARPSRLEQAPILTVGMQSSLTKKSAAEPTAQEHTKKISSGEDTLASTSENPGLNLGQLFALPNFSTWAKFVLGSVFLLAIPILRKPHGLKDVTKAVEEVAEVVEKAAEVTEKVADEIAEALPEGRTKEAALKLEKIALLVDKEAELTESIIDKVDDLVEAADANLEQIEGEIKKINDEEDKMRLKKIVTDQPKEGLQ